MADAFKLTAEDGKRHVWACGTCGIVQREESTAARCCSCHKCGTRSLRRHYLLCEACEVEKRDKEARERHLRELRLIAAATLVDLADYDGDQVSATPHGEEGGYHLPDDDILDADDNVRAWAWACTTEKLGIGTFDARDLVANATEEWFEGAADNFDLDALQKLLDGWCESQPNATCYFADDTRIVVLDPDRRAEVEAMVEEAKRHVAAADNASEVGLGGRAVTDSVWCYSVDGGDTFALAESFGDALRRAMTAAQGMLSPSALDEVEIDIRLASRGATGRQAEHLAEVVRHETETGTWLVPTPPVLDELRMAFEAVLERLCPMLHIETRPKLRLMVEESLNLSEHKRKGRGCDCDDPRIGCRCGTPLETVVIRTPKTPREFTVRRIGGGDEHLAKARELGWEIAE